MKRVRAAVALLGLLALTGCATPAAELPADVTVSVFQNRFDYGIRQLELKVSNGTDVAITITRAALESTRFTEAAVWDRPQVVPAGSARDLKVLLAPPACGDDEPVDTVSLDFTLDSGQTGTASVVPTDETGRLDAISTEDCLGVAVAEHAVISGPAEAVWTPGAHTPAIVDLMVEPTGAAGSATILFAKGTVLLSLVDATGAELYTHDVGTVIGPDSAPSVIRLSVVPARCDPHAVAEDKRGTFFPLEVETSEGLIGRIFVPVSDAVRASLYDFFGDYCNLP
jgi:hypothetical protein